MSDNSEKPKVQIDLGAKAEVKFGIDAKIPEKSAGRLVDALTDLIRPLSESRGLKADLIRLQREDVALKIALKARERLQIEAEEIKPVPTKILLPLLESASLESENDDEMHSQWAGLLASAATRADVEPRYVGILREIQGQQAKLLERVATNQIERFDRSLPTELFDTVLIADAPTLRADLEEWYRDFGNWSVENVNERIETLLDRPGCVIIDIITSFEGETFSFTTTDDSFNNIANSLDFEILGSLGLIARHHESFRHARAPEVQVIYYRMTELGVHFYLACNNVDPEPQDTE